MNKYFFIMSENILLPAYYHPIQLDNQHFIKIPLPHQAIGVKVFPAQVKDYLPHRNSHNLLSLKNKYRNPFRGDL